VSGLLHFKLKESKSYEYIEIRFHGGAEVQWSEQSGPYNVSTIIYKSEETYVNEARILWSSDQSPDGKIGPGTYDLPFQFVIPPNGLSSFQGRFGSILYSLRGVVETVSMFHRIHTIRSIIQVSKIVDINIPRLLMPVHQSKEKHLGFFLFGGDIKFTVSLSRTGFCIGQSLPLTVNVVNGSSRRIKMRATIRRYTHYHVQGHTRHDKRSLTAVITHDIAPHSRSEQTGITIEVQNLVVPRVEPSFTESEIIKMQYFLKVTAVIPWARNFSVKVPITLGNVHVPLNN
jgi:hypothetical protein